MLDHARAVYIRTLAETLGALDDRARDDLAASTGKLRAGHAEAGGSDTR